jgi:hypothetical protein
VSQLVEVPDGAVDLEFLPDGDGTTICLVHPYSSMAAAAGPVA